MTASLSTYDDGKRSWYQDTIYDICLHYTRFAAVSLHFSEEFAANVGFSGPKRIPSYATWANLIDLATENPKLLAADEQTLPNR